MYKALKCPCGTATCNNWLVEPVAEIQGVSFTRRQAEAVAEFLNNHPELEEEEPIGFGVRDEATP